MAVFAVASIGITNAQAQFYADTSDNESSVGDSIMENANKTIEEINRLTVFI